MLTLPNLPLGLPGPAVRMEESGEEFWHAHLTDVFPCVFRWTCHKNGQHNQGSGWSDCFRNQQQPPFILSTTLKTARDFPTQNDSEFIIVSLTGRTHYKSQVVFRSVFSENHGHDAGIADFFLLVSCFSMLPLFFLYFFLCDLFKFHVSFLHTDQIS